MTSWGCAAKDLGGKLTISSPHPNPLKNLKEDKMKKVFIVLLCLITVALSLASCSKPPEYAEIEGRLKELVEASYDVNDILFGDGLEVYERVYEKDFLVHKDSKTNKVYYYYRIEDETLGEVYAYRHTDILYFIRTETERSGEEHVYRDEQGGYYYEITYNGAEMEKEVSSYKDPSTEKTYYFYKIADENYGTVYEYRNQIIKYMVRERVRRPEGEPIYENAELGYYYYEIDYVEKQYELYYDDEDPEGYSYVRFDEKYTSIDAIKIYAETVYSKQYLEGVYEMLFTGTITSDGSETTVGARYIDHEDSNGNVLLMQSDSYESMIKGKRLYDFSTAKVVKPGSSEFANVEIESYLEGEPDKRVTVTLSLVKQEGVWYLDSATY